MGDDRQLRFANEGADHKMKKEYEFEPACFNGYFEIQATWGFRLGFDSREMGIWVVDLLMKRWRLKRRKKFFKGMRDVFHGLNELVTKQYISTGRILRVAVGI